MLFIRKRLCRGLGLLLFLALGELNPSVAKTIGLELAYGYRSILHNEFLSPDSGTSTEQSARFWFYLSENLAMGAIYQQGQFNMIGDPSRIDVTLDGKWSYSNYGPQILMEENFGGVIRPFFSLAYLMGQSRLSLNSLTLTSGASDANLTTQIETVSELSSQGLQSEIGIRMGQTYGLRLSYINSYELIKMNDLSTQVLRTIDGKREAFDPLDQSFSSVAEQGGNKKFGHFTYSFLLGLDIEF